MFKRIRLKQKARKALANSSLQEALKRATLHHQKQFSAVSQELSWESLKEKAKNIREKNRSNLPQLMERFCQEAKKSGAYLYWASTPEEARKKINEIAHKKKAKLIIKAKSMVSEEIELNDYLISQGFQVIETDLGEWLIQLAKERPSHITAPALHKTKEDIVQMLNKKFNQNLPADPKAIVDFARNHIRKFFMEADIGISGANFAVAETGTLVIISNEGNARLTTSLPPVHIALLTTEKFVETLEESTTLTKALVAASSGKKITSYVSFITGPSCTTDIEKELIIGAHGPQEVHIIILDNGRLKALGDGNLEKILSCLKCGGCMLVCPVFQSLGGHVYGGPVYPGGIGVLMTAMTNSPKEAALLSDLCADCKKCEDFCPVGIPTGDLILDLKSSAGKKFWEELTSRLISTGSILNKLTRTGALLQKPLAKKGFLPTPQFGWFRGKKLPALNPAPLVKKFNSNGQAKIYLFQGCLGRYIFPEIRNSVYDIFDYLGYQVISPDNQVCCGAPSLHVGKTEDVQKLGLQNIQSFLAEKPDFILTLCPTGNSLLRKHYPSLSPDFSPYLPRVFDFTEFLYKKKLFPHLPLPEKLKEIFYHHPCHSLYQLKQRNESLELLHQAGYSPKTEKEPTCCGFCGIFSLRNPELSSHIWEKKKKKILETNCTLIASDCPGCLLQLKSSLIRRENNFRVFHTAQLLDRALKESLDRRGKVSTSIYPS
ncbi:MAG: LUD domain-containing protein [Acidobacteriota bacterium]